MQNARGKSLAAVFTARAKPKATVSMPLTWKQISQGVTIADFTISNMPELLKKKGDPWAEFYSSRQALRF
jgi:bifunctional non-homologous end joining protein LigD